VTPFRWGLAAVSFAASIGVSIYIVDTSWPAADAAVSVSPLAHLTLLAAALLELGARGAKFRLSAAALRIPMTYRTALRASAGGDFGGAITPARTGAEPARFLIMKEAGMPAANIVLVIFAELFLEMISLAVVAAAMFVVFRGSGPMILGMAGLVAMYAVFVLGTGALGFALSRTHASGPPPGWASAIGLHAGRWRAIQRALRQLRDGIEGMRDVRYWMAGAALGASLLHVALRLSILPIIVWSFGARPPIAPLILWPIALTYGGVVAPVPAGGGAIEFAFKATLGGAIPAKIFGACLIWWRFYTFYIFVFLGAFVAGGTVLRALRDDEVDRASGEFTATEGAPAAAGAAPAANPGEAAH
jgi:glycosyltransferase 2 family protein